jgi:hypothetical protein
MPMHEKQWGKYIKSWGNIKDTRNTKQWPGSSTKKKTLRSISTAITADR